MFVVVPPLVLPFEGRWTALLFPTWREALLFPAHCCGIGWEAGPSPVFFAEPLLHAPDAARCCSWRYAAPRNGSRSVSCCCSLAFARFLLPAFPRAPSGKEGEHGDCAAHAAPMESDYRTAGWLRVRPAAAHQHVLCLLCHGVDVLAACWGALLSPVRLLPPRRAGAPAGPLRRKIKRFCRSPPARSSGNDPCAAGAQPPCSAPPLPREPHSWPPEPQRRHADPTPASLGPQQEHPPASPQRRYTGLPMDRRQRTTRPWGQHHYPVRSHKYTGAPITIFHRTSSPHFS